MPQFCLTTFALLLLVSHGVGCAMSPAMREALWDPGKQQRERKEEIHRLVELRHEEARLQAASAMVESGRYEECHQMLDEIAKANPDLPEIQLLRAEVFMAQNEYVKASEIYSKLLKKSPGDANLHHLNAMALEFSGDSTGAMLAFQRAAELSPDNSVIQLSQFRDSASGSTKR